MVIRGSAAHCLRALEALGWLSIAFSEEVVVGRGVHVAVSPRVVVILQRVIVVLLVVGDGAAP